MMKLSCARDVLFPSSIPIVSARVEQQYFRLVLEEAFYTRLPIFGCSIVDGACQKDGFPFFEVTG